MRLALHIGTDKAGSTAIQTHLAANRDWFAQHSTYVPDLMLGPDNGHAELFQDLSADKLNAMLAVLRQAASDGYEQALLSWEGLNFYPPKTIRQLAAAFAEFDIAIIVYVREQADIIQSGFLQELKQLRNDCSITVFQSSRLILRAHRQRRVRYPYWRNYYALARRWEKAFRGPAMTVRVFDPGVLHNGNIVDDFLQQLGLRTDRAFIRHTPPGNPSLDAESGFIIDLLQQWGCAEGELRRMIDIALSVIHHDGPWQKYFLDRSTVNKIRRHFDASNRRLARRYLTPIDTPFDTASACWADGGEEAVRARVLEKMRALFAVDATPTFSGEGVSGRDIEQAVLLDDGWGEPQDWGTWCDGEHSSIAFRVMRQQILPQHSHLHLYIRGQYRQKPGQTTVLINGRNMGSRALLHDQPGLDLPLQALGAYERVDIELRHQQDFALEFFGFEYR